MFSSLSIRVLQDHLVQGGREEQSERIVSLTHLDWINLAQPTLLIELTVHVETRWNVAHLHHGLPVTTLL